MKTEELFAKKTDCAGCSACMNICPQKAITMKNDECGNIYPHIDESKCINCGLCKRTCSYQNDKLERSPIKAYAAFCKDDKILGTSSSGGVFASIASSFIGNGGVVYGCSMEYRDEILTPMHIKISNIEDLKKIQGSKYVKSEIGYIYSEIKEDLKNDKKVLFSGTPCQIAALKKYLINSHINSEKLYCMDLVCHGTPGTSFFQDYIKYIEKKNKYRVIDLKFRDKNQYNWGLKGTITYKTKHGKIKERPFYNKLSSYYSFFLKGKVYRENCYSCKYANANRIGDITIGDYWGIENQHPEYLKENGGLIDTTKGISCVLVNSCNGEELLNDCGKRLVLLESTTEKVIKENDQLNHPCKYSDEREKIFKIYQREGYKGVDKYYKKQLGVRRIIYPIYYLLKNIKNKIAKK